jgi:hypothetical protein
LILLGAILGALWAFGGGKAKPTAAALGAATASPTATLVLTEVPTATNLPTATQTPVRQIQVGETASPTPTEVLAPTEAPAAGPTSTRRATEVVPTQAPQPTQAAATATRTARTRSPTETPEPDNPAPELLEPELNASLSGRVNFKWSYSSTLGENEAFQVLIWQGEEPHHGAAQLVGRTQQSIDLDGHLRASGEYWWSVVVREIDTEHPLSPEASPRRFTYAAPGGADDDDSDGDGGGDPEH